MPNRINVRSSYDKRMDNHLFDKLYTDPVIPEDYAQGTALNFNVSAGLQLPMRLKNIYLVPSANINIGGLFVPAEEAKTRLLAKKPINHSAISWRD